MVKGMRVIKDKLRDIDLVVEVRDARIPTSSANPHFDALIKEKSRIIVFNKSDLAEAQFEQVGTCASVAHSLAVTSHADVRHTKSRLYFSYKRYKRHADPQSCQEYVT